MSKKAKFSKNWGSQTDVGRHFGLSAIALGKMLVQHGLRNPVTKHATDKALSEGWATFTPLKDGTPHWMWSREKVGSLLHATGVEKLSPLENEVQKAIAEIRRIEKVANSGNDSSLVYDKFGPELIASVFLDVPKHLRQEVRARVETELWGKEPPQEEPPSSWGMGCGLLIILGASLVLQALFTSDALAQSSGVLQEQIFAPRPEDTSYRWLMALFPSLLDNGTSVTPSVNAIGEILKLFNAAVLAVGGAFIAYNIVIGVMNTAQEGEVLGRKWSSLWAPIRVVSGLALMVPLPSGFTAVQVLVMTVASWGIGLANSIWSLAVSLLVLQGGTLASVDAPPADEFIAGVFQTLVCESTLNLSHGERVIERQIAGVNAAGELIRTSSVDGWGQTPMSVSLVWANQSGRSEAPVCGTVELPGYSQMIELISEQGGQSLLSVGGATSAIGGVFRSAGQFLGLVEREPQTAALANVTRVNGIALAAAGMSAKWMQNLAVIENQLRPAADHIARAAVHIANPNLRESYSVDGVSQQIRYIRQVVQETSRLSAKWVQETAQKEARGSLSEGMRQAGWVAAGAFYLEMANVQASVMRVAGQVPIVHAPSQELASTGDNISMRTAMQMAEQGIRRANLRTVSSAVRQSELVPGAAGEAPPANSFPERLLPQGWDREISAVLTGWSQAASGRGWVNSISELTALGHQILRAVTVGLGASLLGGSFLAGAGNIATGGGFSTIVGMLSVPLGLAIFALISAGIFLAFILPLLPFLAFTVGVVTWLILVIEAIVSAPLWAFSHLRMEGDGIAGEGASTGYRILLSIFLRPALMLLGLLLGMGAFILVAGGINAIYFAATRVALGNDNAGLFGWITFAVLGASINIYLLDRCIGLVHHLPNRVLQWIGGTTEGHDEAGGMSRITGVASAASHKVEQHGSSLLTRVPKGGSEASSTITKGGPRRRPK